MTPKQAIDIAILTINQQIQKIAVDANLHDMYHAPHGEAASKRRKKFKEAIRKLEEIKKEL